MASVNWQKATMQKAGALKKHLGQSERENGNHSNQHIDKSLSALNYAIGCSDYSEALERMKRRTNEVDELIPPLRVKKDRVTCCFLELPCPRTITEQGKSDEFFQKAHEIYAKFFGAENVHGTFVHKDEVHEYTGKDGALYMSCEHSHTLVSAFSEEKGINGKAFETRGKIKALNASMDDMCFREFGIHLNTGETPQRKTVETLKQESEAKKELSELNKRVGELQRAEEESRNKFLEADTKAAEAESRAAAAEKRAANAEQRTTAAEQKLEEANAKVKEATKEVKYALDKAAKASEITSITSMLHRVGQHKNTVSYNENMLDSTRKIGYEASEHLDKANKIKQEAIAIQQRAERKEQAIEPLYQQASAAHRQAEQELLKAKELREQQEKLIKERAEARATEMVSQIMRGTPSNERDRMREYMNSLQFSDGSTALERFDEQERQLAEQLRHKTKSKGYER